MIKKRQFTMLVKSIMDYENRIEQLSKENEDLEVARFGDELSDTVQEFLVEVMDETKKDVLTKWFKGKYEKYDLFEDDNGKLYDGKKGDVLVGGKLIKLHTAGQLYDFLLKKKETI